MAQDSHFKVIIVGGSVAGLALANMLQANDIDFVILESYPKIAPQVGASIGLLPHGNRILDQLGLFDKVMNLAPAVDSFTFRDQSGKPLASYDGMNRAFVERHGYPMLFLDRQMLLQVLYDNLDGSKVLTDKRVIKVETHGQRVAAMTSDGSSFEGDILIGADGIHSTVRDEMWRLADEMQPKVSGSFEREAPPCDYSCIFGISNPCPGIAPGYLHGVFRENSSYLVTGGPGGRVYWFRFQKLPERVYGSAIPRFTEMDLKSEISQYLDDNILPDLKFSTLVENKTNMVLTALPEYVYEKWHFDRIFLLGDSAHKVHPIGGHGGNAAIETAAALVNSLTKALKGSPSGHLSTAQVNSIFSAVQSLRRPRAIQVKDYSHKRQLTESLSSPLNRYTALQLLPLVPETQATLSFSYQIPGSAKLNMIDLPRQQRLIPYYDELLQKPASRGIYQWIFLALYFIYIVLNYFATRGSSMQASQHISHSAPTDAFPNDPTFSLKQEYIGISIIDSYIGSRVAFFLPGFRHWNKALGVLQRYVLGHLIQPITIWSIEAHRHRNKLTILALPVFWILLSQIASIGTIMPLYYVVYTLASDVQFYWWPLSRFVSIHHVNSILPASILGYVLPLALASFNWDNPVVAQNMVAAWLLSPILVPLITTLAGSLSKCIFPRSNDDELSWPGKGKPYDIQSLNRIYLITGACGILLHWFTVFELLFLSKDNNLSLLTVFTPISPQMLQSHQAIEYQLLVNFWICLGASYVWCWAAMVDLNRAGRSPVDAVSAAVSISLIAVVIGPGATMSALWYFRENAMAFQMFKPKRKVHLD